MTESAEAAAMEKLSLDDDGELKKLLNPSDKESFLKLLHSASTGAGSLQRKLLDCLKSDQTKLKDLLDKTMRQPEGISDLVSILGKSDALVDSTLEINKHVLKTKTPEDIETKFQVNLLFAIMTGFDSVNKKYYTSMVHVLPLIKYEEFRAQVMMIALRLQDLDAQALELVFFEFLDDSILLGEEKLDTVFQITDTLFTALDCIPKFVHSRNFFRDFKLTKEELCRTNPSQLVLSALKSFNTWSIDQVARNYVLQNNYQLCVDCFSKVTDQATKVTVALLLTKYWNYVDSKPDLTEVLASFASSIVKGDSGVDTSVEGLVYLSIHTKLKESMRSDVDLIDALKSLIESSSPTTRFGILNVFTNLSGMKRSEGGSGEGLKATLSKKLAAKQGNSAEVEDDIEQIESFADYILELNILGQFSSSKMKVSANFENELVRLVSNLSIFKKLRSLVIKQGGLHFLLTYLGRNSESLKYDPKNLHIENPEDITYPEERSLAIRALAKLLMSSDPNLVFTNNKWPAVTCIPFLCELLSSGETDNEAKFEILIALINLSSLPDRNIKDLTIKTAFDTLEELLITNDEQLQKSTIELVANLSLSPLLLSKFFQVDADKITTNNSNFVIMLNLANSRNIEIQIAAMNFFANLSELEPVALVMGLDDRLFELMMDFCTSDDLLGNEEFVIRLSYILMNICVVLHNEKKAERLDKFKNKDLKEGMLKVLQNTKDQEVLTMCVNICNLVQFQTEVK